MSPPPEPTDAEILEFLDSQAVATLDNRIKEMSVTVRDDELRKAKEGIERQNMHDELVRLSISAFVPGTVGSQQTGYKFATVEPLNELNVSNFDLLIVNERQSTGIFVECKTGDSNWSREVDSAYEAIKRVDEHHSYLEQQLKTKITNREFAICVPSEHQVSLAKELERRENNGMVDVTRDPVFKIWGLHYFGEPKLQLFTRVESNRSDLDKRHRDKRLSSLLGQGINITNEVWAPVFPSSHPTKIASNLVAWILSEKAKDEELSCFQHTKPMEYFNDSENLPHYARKAIGERLSDRFIRESTSLGLLQADDKDPKSFRFTSKGKTIKTILANFQKGYLDGVVERNTRKAAEWQAAAEFLRSQSTLKRFE